MKKLLAFLLALLLLCPALALSEGEEPAGAGEIILVEEGEALESVLAEEAPSEPFIPDTLDRSILGTDDRITVSNPQEYPYSAIAYIYAEAKCGCTWWGSGYMVAQNALMTAAHCLVCTEHNEFATGIRFYFGYKNKNNYLYCYNSRWTGYVGTLFPNGYTDKNDWGYIKFEDANVGERTGWFGMKFLTDTELVDYRFYYAAGYRDGLLKYDLCTISKYDDTRMIINGDTVPGNSGGPIFNVDYYAVGIIVSGSPTMNHGSRLTTEIYNKMHDEGLI